MIAGIGPYQAIVEGEDVTVIAVMIDDAEGTIFLCVDGEGRSTWEDVLSTEFYTPLIPRPRLER